MNIAQVFQSRWFRADDIGDAECKVTIAKFKMEELGDERQLKPVIYFKNRRTNPMRAATRVGAIGSAR